LAAALILVVAASAGLVFNLAMPQGIGWLPAYVSQPRWREVGLDEAARLHKDGALLVDARDPGDYKQARAAGAVNLYPGGLDLLWPLLKDTLGAAQAVLVYGRYRSRWPAAQVAQFLRKRGLERVYVLKADLAAWRAAGLPVKAPRRSRP
jgi:rhodanese-related sulfurtransferase